MGIVEEERATLLASRAIERISSSQPEEAAKLLKEALSLSPNNTAVSEAFEIVRSSVAVHPLLRLCRALVDNKSNDTGDEAVRHLGSAEHLPADQAKECMQLLIDNRRTLPSGLTDQLVTGLVRKSSGAEAFLTQRLSQSATIIFGQLYELGDGSANALAAIVLDAKAWSFQETLREQAERNVFQLFLAKLMEVGHDHDGKALKGIARLLASDSRKLCGLIDEQTFDAILCSLDNRLSDDVRSQATLATAKFLEVAQSDGQKFLLKFIEGRIARHKSGDLIIALSAAASVFPLVPSIASSLFLTEGFVPSLVPLVDKKVKSDKAQQALLDLLSAACIDNACRQSIRKHCIQWLQKVVDGTNERISELAAVVLAKLQSSQGLTNKDHDIKNDVIDVIRKLRRMLTSRSPAGQRAAIEGLAFASADPDVKEQIIKDTKVLEVLVQELDNDENAKADLSKKSLVTFGILTILDNLTRYMPILLKEQQKLSELKAYANAAPIKAEQSTLESEAAIAKRGTILMAETAIIPVLVRSCKHFSSISTALVLSILLSLSRHSKNRGTLVQQGVGRLLLKVYTSIAGNTADDQLCRYTASHALARILISVNPEHVFPTSGFPPLSSAIRPLLTLLHPPPETSSNASLPRDLLPTYESLLSLTNLASANDGQVAEQVTRNATAEIEDLLLSNHTLISRAATELCCNLATSPAGIALFAAQTPDARRRINILLALADSQDMATRRAAGGALAGIVADLGAVGNILNRPGGVERLMQLAEEDDKELVVRGLVALGNVANCFEGARSIEAVGGRMRLRQVSALVDGSGDVGTLAEEALEVLGAYGLRN